MIKHLFTIIWRRKKSNFLLMSEIAIASLVLFAVFTLMITNGKTFFSPMGFDERSVWLVDFDKAPGAKTDSTFMESVNNQLAGIRGIEQKSFTTTNAPFMMSFKYQTEVVVDGRTQETYMYQTDAHFGEVLSIPLTAGKWFSKADMIGKYQPAVINDYISQNIWGGESPIGKLLTIEKKTYQVVGTIGAFKVDHEFQAPKGAVFIPMLSQNIANARILLKVNSEVNPDAEEQLYAGLGNLRIGVKPSIEKLSEKKITQRKLNITPIVIVVSICAFLIINVILGLFGVFWQNISKRREEIGLRRAIGATAKSIVKQFVGEALVIATFALVMSLIVLLQFPLMNIFGVASSVYWWGIVFTIASIYGLIILSAMYPSRQASLIQPTEALRAE